MRSRTNAALALAFVLLALALVLCSACAARPLRFQTDDLCVVDQADGGIATVETPDGYVAVNHPQWVEGQSVPCPE